MNMKRTFTDTNMKRTFTDTNMKRTFEITLRNTGSFYRSHRSRRLGVTLCSSAIPPYVKGEPTKIRLSIRAVKPPKAQRGWRPAYKLDNFGHIRVRKETHYVLQSTQWIFVALNITGKFWFRITAI